MRRSGPGTRRYTTAEQEQRAHTEHELPTSKVGHVEIALVSFRSSLYSRASDASWREDFSANRPAQRVSGLCQLARLGHSGGMNLSTPLKVSIGPV